MNGKKYNIQNQVDQMKNWSKKIDELQAKVIESKIGTSAEPPIHVNELHKMIETARDNLIQIFYSVRDQENNE